MAQAIYTKVVSAARNAAREVLRNRMTSELMTERRVHTDELACIEKTVARNEKKLAIAAFKVEQARAQHDPREEDFQKEFEAAERDVKSDKNNLACSKTRQEEAVAAIDERITKIQNGDTKMSFETMEEMALEFIKAAGKEQFVNGEFDEASK